MNSLLKVSQFTKYDASCGKPPVGPNLLRQSSLLVSKQVKRSNYGTRYLVSQSSSINLNSVEHVIVFRTPQGLAKVINNFAAPAVKLILTYALPPPLAALFVVVPIPPRTKIARNISEKFAFKNLKVLTILRSERPVADSRAMCRLHFGLSLE